MSWSWTRSRRKTRTTSGCNRRRKPDKRRRSTARGKNKSSKSSRMKFIGSKRWRPKQLPPKNVPKNFWDGKLSKNTSKSSRRSPDLGRWSSGKKRGSRNWRPSKLKMRGNKGKPRLLPSRGKWKCRWESRKESRTWKSKTKSALPSHWRRESQKSRKSSSPRIKLRPPSRLRGRCSSDVNGNKSRKGKCSKSRERTKGNRPKFSLSSKTNNSGKSSKSLKD